MKSQGFEGDFTQEFIKKMETNLNKLLKMGFSSKDQLSNYLQYFPKT